MLWFDVGVKRYTTYDLVDNEEQALWFDVGVKRYTTYLSRLRTDASCGLM